MFRKLLSYLTLLLLLLLSSSTGNSAGKGSGNTPDGFNPGPDIITGDLGDLEQYGGDGTQVGLGVSTTSCNAGNVPVDFFVLPNTDHPVIPHNLYRMSGGTSNNERFEQIGQSWVKHTFGADQYDVCFANCMPADFTHLGVGCSDTYLSFQNAGQEDLGSRAWVNPFTGVFQSTANDHTGHVHTETSHRILVNNSDLNENLNGGATYYLEVQYISPHEYTWCQTHPGQCNMYNNASYRQFRVSGTSTFFFSEFGETVRMTAAINAWTGATINPIEPEPGVDGRAFLGYKVTNPSPGVWHYEYALYNENLDRALQSFSVPLGCGITLNNLGFHAPLNHPGFPNDGTLGNAGFSNAEWTSNQTTAAISWSSETFAQNQNANAIRWGTLYNFRFDSDRPPIAANATIGFFKTGAPITVATLGPDACSTAPTPTPTSPPGGSPTPTSTPEVSPTPAPTATPTTTVQVGLNGGTTFTPSDITIQEGDTVEWVWVASGHSVTSGTPGNPDGIFDSGIHSMPFNFSHTFATAGTFPYYCRVHGAMMVGSVTVTVGTPTPSPTATPTPAAQPLNLSTRMRVLTGDNVGIGGFIITENSPRPNGSSGLKHVLVRAIGPSLAGSGVPDAMADTVLELHGPDGFITVINDNWGEDPGQAALIKADGIPPTNELESAIDATLFPGAYTVIVRGKDDTQGVALFEVYDLDQAVPAKMGNTSTRAFVDTGDNVVIAGFILGGSEGNTRIVARGIAIPNIPGGGALDPMLELHDASGVVLVSNNNWQDDPTQVAELVAFGLAPTDPDDAAIVAILSPGLYTAVLAGANDSTGVGVVEVYDLGVP